MTSNLTPTKVFRASIRNVEIRFDGELVNLTNLHKAAGGDPKKKPALWLRTDSAKEFVAEVAKGTGMYLKTTKGRYGGTFAHWQIALAYAKYLSPEFHLMVNAIYRRFMEEEANPSLAIDRAVTRYRNMGMTDAQIDARMKGTVTRNGLTSTVSNVLDDAGVRDYSRFTNQLYHLIFGMNATQLRKERGVKIARDGMTATELRVVDACEALLKDRLASEGYVDRKELAQIVKAVAGPIGKVMKEVA